MLKFEKHCFNVLSDRFWRGAVKRKGKPDLDQTRSVSVPLQKDWEWHKKVAGGLWVECGRVVLGMDKGVAVPSTCRVGGSQLQWTEISTQTQRE